MSYATPSPARTSLRSVHGNVMSTSYAKSSLQRRPLRSPPRYALQRPAPVPVWVATADIVKRLGVTTLAVNKWREGSSQREALPYTVTKMKKANRVHIAESDLKRWLKVHRPDLLAKWEG